MSTFGLVLFGLLSGVYAGLVHAGERVNVVYLDPTSKTEAAIKRDIQDSKTIESVLDVINEEFILSEPIKLVFGAEDGPLFDPNSYTISVPYPFIEEVRARFENANYSDVAISEDIATMDVLAHTLIHEFAHAIIFMHEIPVLGKEEDAADSLATVLLAESFENGQEIAISAADLFDLESEDRTELEEADFWDEHSLDSQRFYSTLCHVYGSDPEQFENLPEQLGFSEERAELCIIEFESLSISFSTLLESYRR